VTAREVGKLRVRVVAPSSVVPQAELRLGVAELRARGLEVQLDRQVARRSLFFAGTHEERLNALVEALWSDSVDVVWCARGGYGANHLLSGLEQALKRRGRPAGRKLLVGSSDATSLLEFARTRLGLNVLHGPMPGLNRFVLLPEVEKDALFSWVGGQAPKNPWGPRFRLRWWSKAPLAPVRGTLVGGNLTVWNTLLGTPFQPRHSEPVILFLEDVTETLPRIDRAVRHLAAAGGLSGVSAIVLGNFLSCEDAVPQVMGKLPEKLTRASPAKLHAGLRALPRTALRPLRRKYSQIEGLKAIFEVISREFGVPVAWGLPVGHGPEQCSLPLGLEAMLTPEGRFELGPWGWT
jgi:muramoyltetrapeptide carboxypeptidase